MTNRHFSPSILRAITFALVVAPAFLARAQTAAPADTSSSNASPAPAAAPAPAPTAPAAAPAAADTNAPSATAPEERPTTYTLAKGDSLDSVAKKFDTSIHALAKLNKIPKSMYRKLRTGQVLQIPPAKSETTTK